MQVLIKKELTSAPASATTGGEVYLPVVDASIVEAIEAEETVAAD